MNGPNENGRGRVETQGGRKLYRLLLAVCGLLLVLDLLDLLGLLYKHAHHGFEDWLGFYSLFGFAAYAFIVGAGWVWRAVVGRGPDYYDGVASGEAAGSEVPDSAEVSSSGEGSPAGGASGDGGSSPRGDSPR